MPIDPQDPNNPNNPPNMPDLSKMLNFDEVRRNIDQFFNEMLTQLQGTAPEIKSLFNDTEALGKKTFEAIGHAGQEAFEKIGEAASKAVGDQGQDAFKKVQKAAAEAMDTYRVKAKQAFELSDFDKMEAKKNEARLREEEEQKKFAEKRHEMEMKFLKATLSKEEYAVQEILHERQKLLQHIEDEHVTRQNLIKGEFKDEKKRAEELVKLDKERDARKQALMKSMAQRERKARGEEGLLGKLSSTIAGGAVGSRAKEDIFGTIAGMAEKFSSVAFILGGIAGVLMKLFSAGQDLLIRQAKQAELSFNAAGKLNTQISEKAFSSMQGYLRDLGMSQDEIQKYIANLAQAPDALGDAAGKLSSPFKKLTDRMGMMGLSAEETGQLIAKASLDWGMNVNDLLKVQERAIVLSRLTGLTASETMNSFLNLNSQLRHTASTTRETATLMALTGKKPETFGATEFQRYQGKLADIIGSFKPSDIKAMFAFVNKSRLPTKEESQKLETVGGATKLYFDYLAQVLGKQINSANADVMIQQLAPNLDNKEINLLLDNLRQYISNGGPNQKVVDSLVDSQQKMQDKAADLEKQGRANLEKSVGVGQHLNAVMDQLVTAIAGETGLTKGIWSLVQIINKIPGLRMPAQPTVEQRSITYDKDQLNRAVIRKTRKNLPNRAYTQVQAASYDPETGHITGQRTAVRFRNTPTVMDDTWKQL